MQSTTSRCGSNGFSSCLLLAVRFSTSLIHQPIDLLPRTRDDIERVYLPLGYSDAQIDREYIRFEDRREALLHVLKETRKTIPSTATTAALSRSPGHGHHDAAVDEIEKRTQGLKIRDAGPQPSGSRKVAADRRSSVGRSSESHDHGDRIGLMHQKLRALVDSAGDAEARLLREHAQAHEEARQKFDALRSKLQKQEQEVCLASGCVRAWEDLNLLSESVSCSKPSSSGDLSKPKPRSSVRWRARAPQMPASSKDSAERGRTRHSCKRFLPMVCGSSLTLIFPQGQRAGRYQAPRVSPGNSHQGLAFTGGEHGDS